MNLYPNQLFHNRYLLVELMGSGASAVVWKALDTKAENMPVALKIFNLEHLGDISEYKSAFQKEFTTVYNMTHTNLLRPSGYDVYDGCQYLTMQFCENGSATSMIGRIDEKDLLHFIHDVAAGLEYLHDHNIIHQDIKPDNVLVDDNCNFLLTDFGISKKEGSSLTEIGGTRAYMAPEVYSGMTTKESDVWSLGATAVELYTGSLPFGENGGLAEVQGAQMVTLPQKLQPQVKALLQSMLSLDPKNRPSASQIRRTIELYQETGSWTRRSNRNLWIYLTTGLLATFLCLGIYFWDYNRVKLRYYKDYTEIYGVPKGIGRVSLEEQRQRQYTFRFEYKRGKLQRVSTINSHGKLDKLSETELNDKYVDATFFYNNNDQIDYVKVYNQSGRCLYQLDYDANLRTVVLKQDDEFGTESTLSINTTDAYKHDYLQKSNISRYKLTYDDKGRVKKREYAGFQNIDVVDEDMIHGILYTYDDNDRLVETAYIGLDGEIRGNKKGLAIKVREYNEKNDFTKITYLTSEKTPSHDGNNVEVVTFEHDNMGNTILERYFDINMNPVIRTDAYVHGHLYYYDNEGHRIKTTNLGMDGKQSFNTSGYVSALMFYDDNGYLSEIKYVDDNDEPINIISSSSYSRSVFENDEKGNTLITMSYDKQDEPIESTAGVWRTVYEYDSIGNMLGERYFDKQDRPTRFDGHQAATTCVVDKFNQLIEKSYYDEDGKPTLCNSGVHKIKYEYNIQGNLIKYSFYGIDSKLTKNKERFAQATLEYDEVGNLIICRYFDEYNNLTMTSNGYAYIKSDYDPTTNFKIADYSYDSKGKLISGMRFQYDNRGNVIEVRYIDEDGKLQRNTVVENYEYNDVDLIIRTFYTDDKGNLTNFPNTKYCQVKYEYDSRGNIAKTSFWDKNNNASYNENKTHIIIKEYDIMDNLIYWKDLDTNGRPNKSEKNYPEVKYAYDNRGNQIEFTIFDGFGKAINGDDGWHKRVKTFNNRNQIVTITFYDLNDKLSKSKEDGFAKRHYTYDNHGNLIQVDEYDQNSELIQTELRKLNDKENVIEVIWKDANGKSPKGKISKIIVEYEEDGLTPKKQSYFDERNLIVAYQTFNKDKNEWSDYVLTNSGQRTGPDYNNTVNWQKDFNDLARKCPIEIEEGLLLQSVSVTAHSIYITLKLTSISKYELGSSDEATIREYKNSYRSYFKQYVPSNVSVYIYIHDKAGREI